MQWMRWGRGAAETADSAFAGVKARMEKDIIVAEGEGEMELL